MRSLSLAYALLFSGLALLGSIIETIRIRAERNWPVVTGVVLESRQFESERSTWVEVNYSYDVGGTRYTNASRIKTNGTRSVPSNYREGAEIIVHYDRLRPSHSYLQPTSYESPISLAVMSGIVMLFCSPFLIRRVLLMYADFMIRRAEQHMLDGLQAFREGQEDRVSMQRAGIQPSEALLDQERRLLELADDASQHLKDFKNLRRAFALRSERTVSPDLTPATKKSFG